MRGIKSKFRWINRISIRLIIGICTIIIIVLTIYTFFTLKYLEADLLESSTQTAFNISDIIKKSTRYGMLLNRREDVTQIVNTIGTEKGVERIRIYNKEGIISYSSFEGEVGKKVDMESEACKVCHSMPELPSDLPIDHLVRKYENKNGEGVFALINPIRNEVDCWNSGCHFHNAETEVLGVIDIILSTKQTDEIIAANSNRIIASVIIATGLIGIFVFLIIRSIINRPLNKIS